MKRFHLNRQKDISGISGTGNVAEGVEFHDGQCVLSWFGKYHNLEIFPNIDELIAIHGHNGCTTAVWLD